MKKSLNMMIFIFSIIILFLFNFSNANPISHNKSVDYMNWDIIVPDDYPTIQDAIDNANEYDTIFIRVGIYNEKIIIDVNAIQLIGEDLSYTVIDGQGEGTLITLKAFLITINGLNISNGNIGITFDGFLSTFNNIFGNTIYNNDNGIIITGAERSNNIYHNTFINNRQNAFDPAENNFWFDTEIKEGNYWDDYNGTDNNGDGIGDIEYNIPGNKTKDKYPLMEPYCFICRPSRPSRPIGPVQGKINELYYYKSSATELNNGSLFYWFEWGDGTNSSWIGPFESGKEVEESHIWLIKDNYDVRVRVKNQNGVLSLWSEPLTISITKSKILNNKYFNILNKYLILKIIIGGK